MASETTSPAKDLTESLSMRHYLLPPIVLAGFLAVSLSAVPTHVAVAQEARDVPVDTDDDDGFDEGLLGLLGLAGLLGLRRRDKDVTTRARTDR